MTLEQVHKLLNQYSSWLTQGTAVQLISEEWIQVTVPFLDRHNDHLQFFVRSTSDGYELTDDSYVIQDLEMAGCDLGSPKRQEIVETILNGFGVERHEDALIVRATHHDFAQKEHALIQSMLALNDMFYTARTTVVALFHEDVVVWLRSMGVRYIEKTSIQGTAYQHRFDFRIPQSLVAPERFVQLVYRPSKNSVEALAFAWIDTHDSRAPDSRGYALLNDAQMKPRSSMIATLSKYGLQPVLWSQRERIKDELAA